MLDEPPGTCEPDGVVCDKYRISHAHRFVWHHVWKSGTTALSPYLTCNFAAQPVAGLLRTLPAADASGYLHVGTSREPLRRFVSAFQEVFDRVRVRRRATSSGGSGGVHGAATGSAPIPTPPSRAGEARSSKCYHRKVPWVLVAMSHASRSPHPFVCTDADAPLEPAALRAVFRQFVADVECGTRFPNGERTASPCLSSEVRARPCPRHPA